VSEPAVDMSSDELAARSRRAPLCLRCGTQRAVMQYAFGCNQLGRFPVYALHKGRICAGCRDEKWQVLAHSASPELLLGIMRAHIGAAREREQVLEAVLLRRAA
jgi:hypothetical protein